MDMLKPYITKDEPFGPIDSTDIDIRDVDVLEKLFEQHNRSRRAVPGPGGAESRDAPSSAARRARSNRVARNEETATSPTRCEGFASCCSSLRLGRSQV